MSIFGRNSIPHTGILFSFLLIGLALAPSAALAQEDVGQLVTAMLLVGQRLPRYYVSRCPNSNHSERPMVGVCNPVH